MMNHAIHTATLGFLGMPGHIELVILLFLILLLFGGKKLPELARSLGKSLSEFKKGRQEGAEEAHLEKETSKEASDSPESPKS